MAILSMAFKSMIHVTITRSRPLLKQFKKNWKQVFQQKERISSSVRSILKTILLIVFPMGPPPLKKCEKCKVEHQVASQIFKDRSADLLITPISKTTKTNHQRQWFVVNSQWNSNWYWFWLFFFYLLLSWPTVNFGSLSRG